MLSYTYTTKESVNKKINIELFDYSFVERWTDYLQKLSYKCPNIEWYTAELNSVSSGLTAEVNVYKLLKIRDCLRFLNNNGLGNYGEEILEIERLIAFPQDVLQYHLNDWHRIFTISEHRFLLKEEKIPSTIDPSELFKVIQDINTYTHHLEGWTYMRLPRRQHYKHVKQYSVQFTNANNLNWLKKENSVFDQDNIEFIEAGGFDFFIESNHKLLDATVWLHEDITGKDQMKAWLDYDNLHEFDITGNLLMTPNVTFDPHKIYTKILNTKKFREESKFSNKTLDRYPLGNITNLDEIDWFEFLDSKIHSITLFDKKLWSTESANLPIS